MARSGPRQMARIDAWHRGIEDELTRERGDALGRTGTQLDQALAEHRRAVDAVDGAVSADVLELLIDDIASRVYALVIQRESAGLLVDNLAHIRACYDIPDAAVRRLGASRRRRDP